MNKLEEIANKINLRKINTNSAYTATIRENGSMLMIENVNSPEAIVIIIITGSQILSITPLFSIDSVVPGRVAELNKILLTISLPLSLSSLGIQDDRYILFGSMAINTSIENLIYEIEVQVSNYDNVMDSIDEFILDN